MDIRSKNGRQSVRGQMLFELFRCSSECFRLRWKCFGMVSMKRSNLIALRPQLIAVCEKMIRNEAPTPEGEFQLRCNEGISLTVSGLEALALLSRIGAFIERDEHSVSHLVAQFVM